MSPYLSVAYRVALASLILAVYCVVLRTSLRFPLREHAVLAAFGATLFGLNYIGVYLAEGYVASGLVAVVFSTVVFMNPVGMRIVYGERLTLRMLGAAVLGVTGVALLFLPELRAAQHCASPALGVAFALGATAYLTLRGKPSATPGPD